MKKGLRGLFNRKKSKGASQQQSEPESTSRELPTDTEAAPTAPATTARAGEDTKDGSHTFYLIQPLYDSLIPSTLPPSKPPLLTYYNPAPPTTPAVEAPTTSSPNPAHHISSPPGIDEAKAVDLNPTTTTDVNTAPPTGPAKTDEGTLEPKVDEGKLAPITTSGIKAETSTGMSATSGPLGDHMAEVYQEVEHDPAEEKAGAVGDE